MTPSRARRRNKPWLHPRESRQPPGQTAQGNGPQGVLETGIQNAPLTMAVIVASFPAEQHAELLVLRLIYAITIVLCFCVVTSGFRAKN